MNKILGGTAAQLAMVWIARLCFAVVSNFAWAFRPILALCLASKASGLGLRFQAASVLLQLLSSGFRTQREKHNNRSGEYPAGDVRAQHTVPVSKANPMTTGT